MFKKNTAITGFWIGNFISTTDGSTVTTGTPTCKRTLDGTAGACANAAAYDATGLGWKVDLAAGDLNGDMVGLSFTLAGCIPIGYAIRTSTKLVSDLVDAAAAPDSTAIQAATAAALVAVNLDHLVGTATDIPALPASTFLDAVGTKANQTTILNRLGAWTGTLRNTVLGAFQALMRSDADATVPSDVNANLGSGAGTAANTTDSTQGLRDQIPAAVLDEAVGAHTGHLALHVPNAVPGAENGMPTVDASGDLKQPVYQAGYDYSGGSYRVLLFAGYLLDDIAGDITTTLGGGDWSSAVGSIIYTYHALSYRIVSSSGIYITVDKPFTADDNGDLFVILPDLPAVLTAAYDAARDTGTELATMLEADGANYKFTADALQEAPATVIDAQDIADALKLAPTAGAPAAGSVNAHLDDIQAHTDLITTGTALTVTTGLVGSTMTITAGAGYSETFSGLTIPATWTAAEFTAKYDLDDDDTAAVVQIRETNGGAANDGLLYLEGAAIALANRSWGTLTVNQGAGQAVIALTAAATILMGEQGGVAYDIKVFRSDGEPAILTGATLNVVLTPTKAIV